MTSKQTRGFWIPCFLFLVSFAFPSCVSEDSEKGPGAKTDGFDRTEMLTFWADHFIIPGYENYHATLVELDAAAKELNSIEQLATLQTKWIKAYKAWQLVSMFDIGKAESNGIKFFTNTYPTNVEQIEASIASAKYNLELPSRKAEQGFPAIDYLVNDRNMDTEEIWSKFEDGNGKRTEYIQALTARLLALSEQVLGDWKDGDFRSKFIANQGSSSTSSVDKMVNDFLYDYEKYTRAGKVGIPAGVFKSLPLPESTEAYYSGGRSNELLVISIEAAKAFILGKSLIDMAEGPSIKSYLDHLGAKKDGEKLSDLIVANFDEALNTAKGLSDDFAVQIEEDNSKMLKLYDVLQRNVVLIKVDAMQAMNIQVDYVDADGD